MYKKKKGEDFVQGWRSRRKKDRKTYMCLWSGKRVATTGVKPDPLENVGREKNRPKALDDKGEMSAMEELRV